MPKVGENCEADDRVRGGSGGGLDGETANNWSASEKRLLPSEASALLKRTMELRKVESETDAHQPRTITQSQQLPMIRQSK